MKILHTSDWHLGQRFINQERGEEHQRALDWLLETIRREQVDALIVAGDVFDSGSPSQEALRQYYDFLTRLARETEAEAVIVGGNHDSPALLEAPRNLLETLRIHVIGAARRDHAESWDIQREIIALRNGVVAAVPFLRDRDLKYAQAGETAESRDASLRDGIRAHYQALSEAMRDYSGAPLIATGHLYAAGGILSDSERDIHLGNLGRVSADHFPPEFAYVALGHLHRAQQVAGQAHIRYCGSLLPLSFAEADQAKSVLLAEFDGVSLSGAREIPVPLTRPLLRWRGSLAAILDKIETYPAGEFPAWIEVTLTDKHPEPDKILRAATEDRGLEVLKILRQAPEAVLIPDAPPDLDSLGELEVFQRLCQEQGGDFAALKDDFLALLSEIREEI